MQTRNKASFLKLVLISHKRLIKNCCNIAQMLPQEAGIQNQFPRVCLSIQTQTAFAGQ